jgi:UDP-N-acetylglucosamine--N-acetylmuramyl-(pentapeptide) pyrophosphoryl-undecaprenol N-acetylglucosamine transferase
MRVLLAGGGTAGHVEPALTLADAIRARHPDAQVSAMGTSGGLEATLVPARGYDLHLMPAVPLPRRPSADLARLPGRLRAAVAACTKAIRDTGAEVVVGFGGYVALPAYLAARRAHLPIVVHEGNARAGLANRVGARMTRWRAVNVPGALPDAVHVGMPLRPAIAGLDRGAMCAGARVTFGLPADAPTLLVFGGSLGAQRLNAAVDAALDDLLAAGYSVIHAVGTKNVDSARPEVPGRYLPLAYIDRMDLAYAAADLAVCRAGAMTCAEVTAVGLPAIYVPLAVGNGEQALNAAPIVQAGGGSMIDDSAISGETLRAAVAGAFTDPHRLAAMSVAASTLGIRDGAERLADLVERAVRAGDARTPGGGR